ncbi:GPI biosynthesis protein family Pig-F-domain-containing protein [Mycena maculata]|uniref:GPI biosynthesis protein family Pig-F-domain-containing protein n=1 Tax=Mycena maculata TaxID=230809 RepID=A0AAD7NKW0_9AGAR|nr:GPI biosynthesis protein family Pig-F-domain-containing protein [Mycena maculata]
MAKKSKARKAAVQENGAQGNGVPDVPPPPGFFPFARYASVVGVHTTLLAFSALFLPRSTEFEALSFLRPVVDSMQLTSRDRPQHPFLDALTGSPVATLAWLCVGAAVLQSWWAGWVRAWAIDFALHGAGIERKLDMARADARKFVNLRDAWLTTAAFSVFFHVLLILFGAPLASHIGQTALLALLLSLLAVFPSAYTLGSPFVPASRTAWDRLFAEFSARTPIERALLYPAAGALAGAWLGVIPIALDWDRPWQAWPLPPTLGAVLGHILTSIAALTTSAVRFFADEHLRATARAHDAKIKTS